MKKIVLSMSVFLISSGVAMSADNEPAKGLQVEVLVFSGRPNPVFTVTDPKEIQELLNDVEALPGNKGFKGASVTPSRLGYKGILVRNQSGEDQEVAAFVVHGKDLEIKPAASVKSAARDFRVDAAAGVRSSGETGKESIERRLLELGREKGALDANLLGAISAGR
ncbi:MAG: hypothetical protein ACHQ49_00335 [Elusimicrobiota bacterium]